MKNITVIMIKSMQQCIDFEKTLRTNHNHKILRVTRNYIIGDIESNTWNYLIELGLADRNLSANNRDFVLFYLTDKGFKFLADLCGFEKIIKIN